MATWQLQDAKDRFGAVVDAALAGEPQRVTRRGKPAVVVLAEDEYERLRNEDAGAGPNFIEHLLAIPKGGPDDLFERMPMKPRDIEW